MLTTEDLTWTRTRLRDCRNVSRQLRICAECLCIPDASLLERLGFTSMRELRAAYPKSRRPCGPPPERIYHRPAPEILLESILRYFGGEDLIKVQRLMGYSQTVTPEAIRHRVCDWKKRNPALAAGMPQKRTKAAKEKHMKMDIDSNGLPAYAYARSPYTGDIVLIVRGERTMFGITRKSCVDTLNSAGGVTRAQAAAMYNGAMCGWDTPYAMPANYNDAGAYIGPEMEEPRDSTGSERSV